MRATTSKESEGNEERTDGQERTAHTPMQEHVREEEREAGASRSSSRRTARPVLSKDIPSSTLTITAATQRYVAELGGAAGTKRAYAQALAAFSSFLVRDKGIAVAIVPVDHLLTAHPAEFLLWLTRRGRTDDGSAYLPRTLAAYTAAVSALYTDLYLHDLIPHVDLVRAHPATTTPRRCRRERRRSGPLGGHSGDRRTRRRTHLPDNYPAWW